MRGRKSVFSQSTTLQRNLWFTSASFNVRFSGFAELWLLCRAFSSLQPLLPDFPGGLTARVTPVPIPHTEVKPCRADDTALETTRERRSPPGLKFQRPLRFFSGAAFFVDPSNS